MTVPETLDRADRARAKVVQILQGEYKDETRLMVLLAYVDLAIEHHEAIGLLLRSKLHGSAFSLTRVVFEILFCAHWVARCASDRDLEKIAFTGNFEFPGMGKIVTDVDTAFGTDGFFADIKRKGWRGMNSYTHSGLLQLAKRFKGSKVEPNYSDEAVMETVDAITSALLLLGRLLADSVGRVDEVGKLDMLIEGFGAPGDAQ